MMNVAQNADVCVMLCCGVVCDVVWGGMIVTQKHGCVGGGVYV